jgi:hypothetical protein
MDYISIIIQYFFGRFAYKIIFILIYIKLMSKFQEQYTNCLYQIFIEHNSYPNHVYFPIHPRNFIILIYKPKSFSEILFFWKEPIPLIQDEHQINYLVIKFRINILSNLYFKSF